MKRAIPSIFLSLVLILSVCFFPPSVTAKDREGRYVVLIDPAHGGRDDGVRLSTGLFEKDVTLTIARLIEKEFAGSKKIRIRLSRMGDTDVPRSDRIREAIKSEADLFLSVHVNAGFGRESSGFEVYFQGFRTLASVKVDKSASSEIVKDMVRTKHLNESVRFAKILQAHMDKVFPRMDRGLRDGPVLVLQGLNIPAVALEVGFATNTKDRKKLTDEGMQRFVSHALSESIGEFFK
jgi:N-acetylmuramoyl-L-alanine amidase